MMEPGSTRSTKALPSRISRSPSPGVLNFRNVGSFGHLRPMEVVPCHGTYELHEGKPANKIRAPRRQVEGERRSPILRHQKGRRDAGRGNEGVEITDVILEAIGDVGLAGLAEA